MAVIFELPSELELRLRGENAKLDSQAKEATLIELYRQDRLSHHELAQALGVDRLELDRVLKQHHVTEDLPTADEYNAVLAQLSVKVRK